MPLRCLEYIARLYERLYDKKDKYGRKSILIDNPEFFVIYNGDADYPAQKTLKLSDSFKIKRRKIKLELIVEVININKAKHNNILDKCQKLNEYSQFVEISKKFMKKEGRNGFENAIKYCIEQDILGEYLDRKSREVENMLVSEYCYEDDIAVQRAESREEGIAIGIKEGLEKGISKGSTQKAKETAKALKKEGISLSLISKCTGLSIEEIKKL